MVKVALDHIGLPIWRRLVVPASITLDLLHDMLQGVMGWEDYHLHQFTIAGRRFTEFVADDDPDATDIGENENGIVLATLLTKGMGRGTQEFACAYDFGDSWQHTLTIETIEPIPEGHEVRISCLAGRRRCPPEDVGGIFGYQQYLQALADPKHPQHQELLR